jgi:hypothetical protein
MKYRASITDYLSDDQPPVELSLAIRSRLEATLAILRFVLENFDMQMGVRSPSEHDYGFSDELSRAVAAFGPADFIDNRWMLIGDEMPQAAPASIEVVQQVRSAASDRARFFAVQFGEVRARERHVATIEVQATDRANFLEGLVRGIHFIFGETMKPWGFDVSDLEALAFPQFVADLQQVARSGRSAYEVRR